MFRGYRIRTRFDRAQRLFIQLASYLQSIANLLTPNRRSRLGAFFTCDGAVVKTLPLESLLQRSNRRIAVREADRAERDGKT